MNIKSKSWIDLEPLKDEKGNTEPFNNYYSRIQQKTEFSHIPKSIFEQWLWAHHEKDESFKNYGWLDYENIEFKICSWSNEQLKNIYVIESYRDYYEERANYKDFSSFCCEEEDLNEWQKNGTWRTPPIIIDLNSINGNIPNRCKMKSPYQLVEGHSRLGYLYSMFTIDRLGNGNVAEKHDIFLMRMKNMNA